MASSLLPSLHPSPPLFLPSSPHGFPHLFNGTRRGGRFLLPPPPPYPRGQAVARMGSEFADFHTAEAWARGLFEKAEGFVYTVADAAVSASSSPDVAGVVAEEGQKQGRDWLSGITDYMETVLKVLKDGLSAVHVPYAYGFAIILLTVLVKAATFPLTKKQVESALAMRSLQPQMKAIQERYQGDQERIQLETARLYKLAGVNPLAGCLPTLATIPVWIGLYRALSNVANEGLLTEGFFWIPSLAGPTTVAARQSGSGVSWLFPFVDGHPPLGWHDTLAYLVLPVLLVISQYISAQIMQPAPQGDDPSQKNAQAITKFLPLMIGYFSLSVPSGLSLYWFTNNLLSMAQQIWLQKLGGAKNPVKDYSIGSTDARSSIQAGLDVDFRNEKSAQAKSVPELDVTIENPTPAKLGSGGLRPGERFKMIKEQEARRRREREEEKRKAEEAAGGSPSSTVDDKVKILSVDSGLQVNVSSSLTVDAEGSKHASPVDDPSLVGAASVNHSHTKQDSNEEKSGDTQSLAISEAEPCSSISNQTNERAGELREKVSEKD